MFHAALVSPCTVSSGSRIGTLIYRHRVTGMSDISCLPSRKMFTLRLVFIFENMVMSHEVEMSMKERAEKGKHFKSLKVVGGQSF